MPIDDLNLTKLTNDEQYDAKLAALRAAIDEGDASSVAEGDVFARVRKTLKLPSHALGPLPKPGSRLL
jgi:hypothetical protein